MILIVVKMTKAQFQYLIKQLWGHEKGQYFISERWLGGEGRIIYPGREYIPREPIRYSSSDDTEKIELRLHSKPMPQVDLDPIVEYRE